MPFNTYDTERDFFSVAEAILGNYDCGHMMIRKGSAITQEKLSIKYETCRVITGGGLESELSEIENSEKCDTFICIVPLGLLSHVGGTRSEFSFINAVLNSIKKDGRLIAMLPSGLLTAPYAESLRTSILNKYRINSIIQLPNSAHGGVNGYVLDIENSYPKRIISYYSKKEYGNIYDLCMAIKENKPAFNVSVDMLTKRWDAQYLDPQYNDIRKKYLEKDTVRLGDLASVIPGTRIRRDEKYEKGEYLVLSPGLVSEGKINYRDNRAFFTELRKDDVFFLRAVLKDGDIVVCTDGKIRFLIYHQENQKVVAGHCFNIIRSSGNNQKQLQLYFSTTLGEESFNLQAQMLSVGVAYPHLTPRTLASFAVPNAKTLELAAKMQEIKNLINKIALLFESEGWEVIRKYKAINGISFDLALKTQGRVVGIVEARKNLPSDLERKKQTIRIAEEALKLSGIHFFILFIGNAMYSYKDNKFFRIPEIPTPTTYKQYIDQKEFYEDNTDDSDLKEIPGGAAPVADSYLILSAISNLGQMLGEKIDAVQKTVDFISMQLQELSGRISIYQELVEKQLEYAKDDLEEQERILRVFTDTCVERVTDKIRSEYAIELYTDEKEKLIHSMGEPAWNKLSGDAQNFLISSKVMYEKLIGISDIVDYSGVCLLVTKALELELGKRFCQDYISYYKATYPGKNGRTNAPLPIVNKYRKYIKAHDFTLGSFPFIIGSQFVDDIDDIDKDNIRNKIVEYARQGVLKTYALIHSDEEILDLLSDYAEDIERVRKDYRNPSAHTNALTKISAKECFDLVLDVEKLLKKMLDSFDY